MSDRKRSIFGVVFLTIFLDMVGFSIIFPLFPDMLDHYLFLEQSMGGGIISRFVSWVSEFGHDLLPGNPNFRLETVIFGGILTGSRGVDEISELVGGDFPALIPAKHDRALSAAG